MTISLNKSQQHISITYCLNKKFLLYKRCTYIHCNIRTRSTDNLTELEGKHALVRGCISSLFHLLTHPPNSKELIIAGWRFWGQSSCSRRKENVLYRVQKKEILIAFKYWLPPHLVTRLPHLSFGYHVYPWVYSCVQNDQQLIMESFDLVAQSHAVCVHLTRVITELEPCVSLSLSPGHSQIYLAAFMTHTSLVPRPLPDFISQPRRKHG